ncbi:MAG: hypothetical protein GTN67_01445, partial [Hydrotalea flava]|nr:hypothetical protein [Hydrotalea flava]NIM36983.1 hypothetical protein [Hydrotalea flava]NIN02175.1 hypothetical protein [Hydrotalea flava]NIN13828.1 hypothetical protein [Hydrotalea flava]NIO92909.1 hypothetical protein [Hydrotalea flava]
MSAPVKPHKLDIDLIDSFEKIPVKIFDSSNDGSLFVAREIAALIKAKQAKNETCVLG